MAKAKWAVDVAHSSIDFSVKHMMVSKVKGTFQKFDAAIEADPEDLTTANISFWVDVASIDTRNPDREGHLKSGDFFDVENHPELTFNATKIEKTGDGKYDVTGDLTIRGTTKPITFAVTYEGSGKDPMSGDEVAGFSGAATLNRKDFGLVWNVALETGGVLVGDQVKISIELEAHKQN
ncbi:YceI family protein [Alicyclobacillus sp. SO9]|uniref:YceI family protein n=1 Tax=Alicyclobacillus sp. SO9 TaxID=2665646 RepID=UPI0018E8809A|nr:YceI family protein [Alicyclobacillus sp. SO9]QQE77828.1 YceI family protein [Alicyclobacillus sp. SO9]